MAIVLIEGFDHMTTGNQYIYKGWSGIDSYTTGRYGGRCHYHYQYTSTIYKKLPSTYTTLYVGFAFKLTNTSVSTNYGPFSILRLTGGTGPPSGGGDSGTTVVKIMNTTVGQFYFANASNTQLGGTFNLTTNVWYHMQIKVVVSATVGQLEARLDGDTVPFVNVSNVNTGSTPVGYIQTGFSHNGPYCYIDDMWACDTTGSTANGFLGDVKVETVYPNGVGSSTDWVRGGTDSGANWSQVDENTPNTDTDYVASMSSNTKDLYAVTDLSTLSGTIYGVQHVVMGKKDDAGMRKIQLVAKSGASESTSSDITLSSDYLYYTRLMDDKPGGTGWTISEVNAAEFGVKVSG